MILSRYYHANIFIFYIFFPNEIISPKIAHARILQFCIPWCWILSFCVSFKVWCDLSYKMNETIIFFLSFVKKVCYCVWVNKGLMSKLCSIFTNSVLVTWNLIQCKPDISRLVGSMERYRDISGSAIYRATAMSQNPGQVFQRVVSCDGAFVCLAANSARRQRISWHLSKFDVALQNRVVEFQTKAVCSWPFKNNTPRLFIVFYLLGTKTAAIPQGIEVKNRGPPTVAALCVRVLPDPQCGDG